MKSSYLGDGMPLLRRLVDGSRPDLVFNFAEGTGSGRSREARVPAVLEMLDIPYTGSDPLTLAATLDKPCAKQLVRGAGLATPDWLVVSMATICRSFIDLRRRLTTMPLPVIVKPACEGSSKGIHADEFRRRLRSAGGSGRANGGPISPAGVGRRIHRRR